MKKITNILLPPHSFRRKLVKKVLVGAGLKQNVVASYYNTWVKQGSGNVPLQFVEPINGPLISVVVPAYNTPRRFLDELIYSIISQSYTNWELLLVNASSEKKYSKIVEEFSLRDKRIKIIETENKGISHNTNKGIKRATGDYIAFCDHDDILDPFALYEVAKKIVDEGAEVIYTDEDKISENSEIYFDPHFKPDWSPDLFTNVNYVNHLTVIKKELVIKAGLLNKDRDGAQDYDLLLRIIDLNPKIAHVSKILYHWRAAQNSTASDFDSKKNITNSARLALEEHFARQDVKVSVVAKEHQPGFYKLQFELPRKISLIITPFASDALLRLFIEILLTKTNSDKTELHLIIPNGVEPRYDEKNVKVFSLASDPRYLENAVNTVKTEDCVIIQQIIMPQSDDWLQELCGPLALPHVATVAPLIVRDGVIIEDAGLVKTAANELQMLFINQPAFNNQTSFGNTNWVRNVDALSGGTVAVKTKAFSEFIKLNKPIERNLVTEYSLYISTTGKYNVIFTQVILDNFSIRMRPANYDQRTFFSPNLVLIGGDYELYTPESAVINVLTRIGENEKKS